MATETICNLFAEAKRKYFNPQRLEREELIDLVEDFYQIIHDMQALGEKMDNRLSEYQSFCSDLHKDLTFLKGDREWQE